MLSCECGPQPLNIPHKNPIPPKVDPSTVTILQKLRNLFLISTSSRINGSYLRNNYGLFRERERQLVAFPGTIHPFSDFRWCWDIFMTFVLLLSLFCQPLKLAFYSARESEDVRVIIASLFVDFIFFLDIFFNFRTGFQNSVSELVNLNLSTIRSQYLRSWFFIDFLSSIPFDGLYFTIIRYVQPEAEIHDYFKIIRLLGILRIFRLFRAEKCLERLENAYKLTEFKIRLINLYVMIFTIAHWLACWHWLVCDLFNPPGHRKEFAWISRLNLWDKPIWLCYISSALRALSNMGCLGYGGLGGEAPIEPEDIIATIISIMIGATCFALYIGTMTNIVQGAHASEKKFGEAMNEVKEYMKFRHIPLDLQDMVTTYYDHRYRRHYFDEPLILNSVSDVLRTKLMLSTCAHMVDKVDLFRSLPESIIQKLVANLKFEVYLPGDVIIHAGEEGEAMYFIQDGSVAVNSPDGHAISTLEAGDHFGEISLVLEEQKTMATVVAKDYCDVYRLDKRCFKEVFRSHSELYAKLHSIAKRRVEETTQKISTSSSTHCRKCKLGLIKE